MALLEQVYETRVVQEREKKAPDDLKAMTAEMAKLSTGFKNIQEQNKDIQDRLSAHQLHAVQCNSFDPSLEVCNASDEALIFKDVSVQNQDELIPVNADLSQNIPV